MIPDSFIQNFFMNPVRAAIAFPVPLVAPADVFHTAAAIKNYRKALELRPDYAKAQRRIKKLEKEGK